jgi:hypothetical protein
MQHSLAQAQQDTTKSGKEKFRSSCDRCSSSKVRCNKEHPRCQRCQQQRLSCVYGRSRRKGKPPSKITLPQAPPSTLGSSSPEPPVEEDWHSQPWRFDVYGGFADFHQGAPGENQRRPEMPHGEFGEEQCPFPVLPALDTADWPTLNSALGNQLFTQSGNAPPMLSRPPPTLLSGSTTAVPDTEIADIAIDFTTDDSNCSYIATALSTLASLYQLSRNDQDTNAGGRRPPSIPTSASHSTSSTNIVILTTRNATQTLSRLIACTYSSCRSDSTLPFVLANIAVKILGEYRAFCGQDIYSPRDSIHRRREDSSSSSSQSTDPLISSQASGGISSMFTALGGLQLSRTTQMRMKAQLLLCELEPLAQAALALERCMRSREAGHGEDQVWKSIERYLKQGVADLMRSLEAVCGRID